MTFLSYLHFFCFLANSYLAVFIINKDRKSLLHRVSSCLFLSFSIWNLGMVFAHSPHVSKDVARLFTNITSLGWCSFSAFVLLFFLVFTENKKILQARPLYALLFMLPLLFIYEQWTNCLIVDYIKQSYGWRAVWTDSIWVYVYYLYICLCMGIGFFVILGFSRRTRDSNKRKQSQVILASFVAFPIGFSTDVVFPELGIYSVPDIADITTLIYTFGIVYAIVKFKFLAITPAMAAENIISTMNDALILLNPEGKIVRVNKATLDLLGYEKEELEGTSAQRLFGGKEVKPSVLGASMKCEDVRNSDFTLRTKDGEDIPVSFSSSVLPTETGAIAGTVCIARDMSEHRRIEKKLARAEKLESIGTLAGGVAHDLNNILAGLVSYPELLLMEMPDDSPLRKPILTIQNLGEKAATIVQDLLTLSRRGVSVKEVMNLNDMIYEYLTSPEHEKLKACHPEAQVEDSLDPEILNILGSPVHLSRTVMNMFSNAAESMPGGGRILISTENRYLDSPIRGYDDVAEGDYVVLSVSNTGVGISPEDRERIFEPFYTKKAMGRSGTGLGMAVVWGTVKDHKGYIDVQSAEGRGTTFTLYFPVTRKEPSRWKSALSLEDYRGNGESILVVDDVEEQREIASRILTKLGYFVSSVSSGEEAVEYLRKNSADLLVLDMIMDPGIDGLDTYKRILEIHPKQKAIIVSGFSETERVKEAQKLGAGSYVKKPYLLERIGVAVRDELEG